MPSGAFATEFRRNNGVCTCFGRCMTQEYMEEPNGENESESWAPDQGR